MAKKPSVIIPEGWKETTIGELLFPVSDTFDFTGKDKVHFLNTGDILDGKLLHWNLTSVDSLPGQAKKSFKINDILYSEIRPANKRYMLVDFDGYNSVASTKLMVLRTRSNVDLNFIYNFITSKEILKEFQLIAESRSGTFPQITFDSISKIPLSLPTLPEQRLIATVLSSFDDKIILLQKQNKTLENIAQALFKHWFIDFEFFNKDGKPYKSSGGKMIDSEMGEIPNGWEVKTIEQITSKVTKGTTPTTIGGNFSDSGINFIKAESITNDHYFDLMKFSHIDTVTNELLSRSVVCGGDLLYTIAGTIGRFAVVSKSILPANTNQAVAIIRANTEITDPFYLQCMLSLQSIREALFGNIVEAVQANLSLTSLKESRIIIPDINGFNLFRAKIRILFDKIVVNKTKIQTLSKIRNTILPKLMKGELRVKGFN